MGWTRRTRLILGSALVVVLLIAAVVIAVLVMRSASDAWYSTAQPAAPGASVVEAADAFIATLDDEQMSAAMYDFADPVRSNWSNLPAGVLDFDRNGVRVGDLDDEQTTALVTFLSAALSERGYAVTIGIVGADRELSDSVQAFFLKWSSENYWLAFFGEPSESEIWGWQFGGHHLALNVTVADGRSYMSPTFLGVEPSSYMDEAGSTVSPLDTYIEAGLALFNSLDADTRRLATVTTRPEEVWAGAGKDGFIPALEGAPVSGWSESHRQSLLDTVALWLGVLDDASSQARLAEIGADLDGTYFAWKGDANGSIYYRIQGPTLIIELSSQGAVGGGGHYHSIYRDPTNEYGGKTSNGN